MIRERTQGEKRAYLQGYEAGWKRAVQRIMNEVGNSEHELEENVKMIGESIENQEEH